MLRSVRQWSDDDDQAVKHPGVQHREKERIADSALDAGMNTFAGTAYTRRTSGQALKQHGGNRP